MVLEETPMLDRSTCREKNPILRQFSESNSQKIKSGIPSSSLIGVKVFKSRLKMPVRQIKESTLFPLQMLSAY